MTDKKQISWKFHDTPTLCTFFGRARYLRWSLLDSRFLSNVKPLRWLQSYFGPGECEIFHIRAVLAWHFICLTRCDKQVSVGLSRWHLLTFNLWPSSNAERTFDWTVFDFSIFKLLDEIFTCDFDIFSIWNLLPSTQCLLILLTFLL